MRFELFFFMSPLAMTQNHRVRQSRSATRHMHWRSPSKVETTLTQVIRLVYIFHSAYKIQIRTTKDI